MEARTYAVAASRPKTVRQIESPVRVITSHPMAFDENSKPGSRILQNVRELKMTFIKTRFFTIPNKHRKTTASQCGLLEQPIHRIDQFI